MVIESGIVLAQVSRHVFGGPAVESFEEFTSCCSVEWVVVDGGVVAELDGERVEGGQGLDVPKAFLREPHIEKILEAYRRYEDITGFAHVASVPDGPGR